MAKACDYTKWIIIVLLVVLTVVIVMEVMKNKKSSVSSASSNEGFAHVAEYYRAPPKQEQPHKEHKGEQFYWEPEAPVAQVAQVDQAPVPQVDQSMQIDGRGMSPPNLAALPVAPRSNLPGLQNGGILGDAPSLATSAAPPQPVMGSAAVPVDFSTMGGAPSMPNAALTSQQASSAFQNKMNGGKPEYMEPELPLADIGNMSVDPTNPMNPENFMFTRTIFAPLKRRYGNGVDFFRGDIDVTQEYRGWFDISPAVASDVVQGYVSDYLDIQQETALKDASFYRGTPSQTLYESSINTGGDQFRTAYSVV